MRRKPYGFRLRRRLVATTSAVVVSSKGCAQLGSSQDEAAMTGRGVPSGFALILPATVIGGRRDTR
jgi:hypothetical protein